MTRFILARAGGLAIVLTWAGSASAQNQMNGYGGYPTPLPYNQAPGSYVVGPSLRGAGGTYSYVQQNTGAGMGTSPNAYYSMNYFTATPMTSGPAYQAPAPGAAYSSRYVTPSGPAQAMPSTSYVATPTTSPTYSSANATYYNNRRGGPLRRMFGRR